MKAATLQLSYLQQISNLTAYDRTFSARFSDLFCTLHQTRLRRSVRIPISMNLNGRSTTTTSGNSDTEVCLWRTSELLRGCHTVGSSYACLVLNRPLQVSPPIVKKIWQNALIRCLIDGGANHWNEFLHMHCEGEKLKLPEYITGDFDSITEETRKLFSAPDIKYQHTPNQNETDFTKALRFLQPLMKSQDIQEVIVFQENTGRLDQIMANINTLFKLKSDLLNIYLLSSACLSWLLLPGKHKIIIPKELVDCQRWCALIPVGSRANSVTTTGLKWNLSKSPMEFGHMVSTSNTYAAQEVCIETDGCLIWSMGLWAQND